MKNSLYWEKRLANNVWSAYNTLEEQNLALLGHYSKTMDSIRSELLKLEEQKKATRSERYRIQHLKSIQEQIIKECEKLGDSIESEMIRNVSNQMQDVYEAAFTGIRSDKFSKLSKNACKDIINTQWQGSSFSKRLWGNTGKLATELTDILSTGITKGTTVAEMAFQLSNRMNKDLNICHRLVRTETINSLNRASLRGLKDAGVKYSRWWAAEDERTCKSCGANHGKAYPIDRAPNLPCHPGCRCTWLPIFEDELTKEDIQHLYDLSNDELYAVNQYVSSESYKINDILRRGTSLSKSMKQMSKNLDEALNKLDNYEGDVTRSLSINDSGTLKSFLHAHKVGNIVTYPEYISTTSSGIYNKKGNIQIYILNSKKGKDLTLINKSEKEVLYKRNSSFKVVAKEERKGKVFILLEELS